jgi:hypothetical protein
MLVGGFILGADQARGQTMIGTGIVLASLAGLELSIREHFSGFRSHTTLLAAAVGVGTMLVLYYLVNAAATISLVAGAAAALGTGWALVRVFRNRSGRLVKVR